MANDYPVIDVRLLSALSSGLEAAGLPFAALAERAGILPSIAGHTSGVVSLNSVGLLLDLAADMARDADLGLKLGAALPPGSTGVFGHIMLSAQTVRDMLKRGCDFMPLHTRPVDCGYAEDAAGVGTASWSYSSNFTAPRAQFSLFAVSALVGRVREVAGRTWMPLGISLDFKEPRDLTSAYRYLGANVRFQQQRISIEIDPDTLALALPQTMVGLDATLLDLGRRLLAEIEEEAGHRATVAIHLRRRMLGGLALSLEYVANDMGLTARALQYRLDQEQTGFEAILTTVRGAETVHYLRDTDLSLSEIAGLLGFSEASAFTRAVRHRFQMTPRDLRRHLQAGHSITPPHLN